MQCHSHPIIIPAWRRLLYKLQPELSPTNYRFIVRRLGNYERGAA